MPPTGDLWFLIPQTSSILVGQLRGQFPMRPPDNTWVLKRPQHFKLYAQVPKGTPITRTHERQKNGARSPSAWNQMFLEAVGEMERSGKRAQGSRWGTSHVLLGLQQVLLLSLESQRIPVLSHCNQNKP